MNKVILIIKREFLTRVRKKSFWVMAFLGPLLLALAMIVPLWIGTHESEGKTIRVIDESEYFKDKLASAPGIDFKFFEESSSIALKNFLMSEDEGLLYIPSNIFQNDIGVKFYTKSKVSPEVKFYIEKNLNLLVSYERLRHAGISDEAIASSNARISLVVENMNESNMDEDAVSAAVVAALFSSVLIFFFIVLYGGQVMRGVIEEKTNRIIEIIVSSVTPVQLMLGKITGIALVSFTQFIVWLMLTFSISYFVHSRYERAIDLFSDEKIEQTIKNNPQLDAMQAAQINRVVHAIDSIDFAELLFTFFIYFSLGYLLYAAVFAGIGSAVDSETETQQFVLPLIAPLMVVMVMATSILTNPHGALAYWLSIIPFTSPVAMMLRLPFDVPIGDLVLSIVALLTTFILITILSARVYRVGILMYGKKVTAGEIVKWMFK